jgi:hypothetical protein
MNENIILSFDVGIINLSYCLLKMTDSNINIIEWNIINLINKNECKCECGDHGTYTNTINQEIKYYCNKHNKINMNICEFNEYFKKSFIKNICIVCNKNGYYSNDNTKCYCNYHAKKCYNDLKMKPYKHKQPSFEDIKYNLLTELEKRTNLLNANYVIIENQPSFKNPRMKSISSTIYDYYLLRGIFDKNINNSNIKQVKFMSPSNKLKLINDDDKELLKQAKNKYKITKELGIKYCSELIKNLNDWSNYLNNSKKKDDLADCFLQAVYFSKNNYK